MTAIKLFGLRLTVCTNESLFNCFENIYFGETFYKTAILNRITNFCAKKISVIEIGPGVHEDSIYFNFVFFGKQSLSIIEMRM